MEDDAAEGRLIVADYKYHEALIFHLFQLPLSSYLIELK